MSGQPKGPAKISREVQSHPGEFLTRKYSLAQTVMIYLIRAFLAAVSLPLRIGGLPRQRAIYIGLGTMLYHLLTRYRRVMLINLDIAFSNEKTFKEKKRIALDSFGSLDTSVSISASTCSKCRRIGPKLSMARW